MGKDSGHLVLIALICLGLAGTFPLFAFISSPHYLKNFNRYATQNQYLNSTMPETWKNAPAMVILASTAPNLMCRFIMLADCVRKSSIFLRLCSSLALLMSSVLIVVVVPLVGVNEQSALVWLIVSCVGVGVGQTICLSTAFGLSACFPRQYVQCPAIGLSASGAVASLLQILTSIFLHRTFQNRYTQGTTFFILALVVLMIGFVVTILLKTSSFSREYVPQFRSKSKRPIEEKKQQEGGSRGEKIPLMISHHSTRSNHRFPMYPSSGHPNENEERFTTTEEEEEGNVFFESPNNQHISLLAFVESQAESHVADAMEREINEEEKGENDKADNGKGDTELTFRCSESSAQSYHGYDDENNNDEKQCHHNKIIGEGTKSIINDNDDDDEGPAAVDVVAVANSLSLNRGTLSEAIGEEGEVVRRADGGRRGGSFFQKKNSTTGHNNNTSLPPAQTSTASAPPPPPLSAWEVLCVVKKAVFGNLLVTTVSMAIVPGFAVAVNNTLWFGIMTVASYNLTHLLARLLSQWKAVSQFFVSSTGNKGPQFLLFLSILRPFVLIPLFLFCTKPHWIESLVVPYLLMGVTGLSHGILSAQFVMMCPTMKGLPASGKPTAGMWMSVSMPAGYALGALIQLLFGLYYF